MTAPMDTREGLETLPTWQQMQFGMLMGKLSDWRNEDQADALTLCRSDVIAIIDAVKALRGVAQAAPKLSDPHPHWSVENKNEDYPKSVDEWDPRKDPVGQHLALAEKRLRVAMDRDDPRAPEEMALISRWDLTTLVHDWWHKCAVFDLWLAERKAKEASLVSSTHAAPRSEDQS